MLSGSNRQKAGAKPGGSGVSSGTTKDANGSSDASAAASTAERSHPGEAPRSLAAPIHFEDGNFSK